MRLVMFVLGDQRKTFRFKPLGGDRRGGASLEHLERLDCVDTSTAALCIGALGITQRLRVKRGKLKLLLKQQTKNTSEANEPHTPSK